MMEFCKMSLMITLAALVSGCATTMTKVERDAAIKEATIKLENSLTRVQVPVFTAAKNTNHATSKEVAVTVQPIHELKVAWIRDYDITIANEPLYEDNYQRLPYIVSVSQFKQKGVVWKRYASFKFSISNYCESVLRPRNILLTAKVDGVDIPDFIARDENNISATRSPFTISAFAIAPRQVKRKVLQLIPLSYFKRESGSIEIVVYDVPKCGGGTQAPITIKYDYNLAMVKVIPPKVDSIRLMLEQRQVVSRSFRVAPFSRLSEYKTLSFVNAEGVVKYRLSSPREKIRELTLPRTSHRYMYRDEMVEP